jgi:hypothetical protein
MINSRKVFIDLVYVAQTLVLYKKYYVERKKVPSIHYFVYIKRKEFLCYSTWIYEK